MTRSFHTDEFLIPIQLLSEIDKTATEATRRYFQSRKETSTRIRAIKFRRFGDQDILYEEALQHSLKQYRSERDRELNRYRREHRLRKALNV